MNVNGFYVCGKVGSRNRKRRKTRETEVSQSVTFGSEHLRGLSESERYSGLKKDHLTNFRVNLIKEYLAAG